MKPDSGILTFWPLSASHKDSETNADGPASDEPAVDDNVKTAKHVVGDAAAAPGNESIESIEVSVGTQMVAVDKQPISTTAAIGLTPTQPTQASEIQAAALSGGAGSLAS